MHKSASVLALTTVLACAYPAHAGKSAAAPQTTTEAREVGIHTLSTYFHTSFAVTIYSTLNEIQELLPEADFSDPQNHVHLKSMMRMNFMMPLRRPRRDSPSELNLYETLQRTNANIDNDKSPQETISNLVQELNRAAAAKIAVGFNLNPQHRAALALLKGLDSPAGVNAFFDQKKRACAEPRAPETSTNAQVEEFLLHFGWQYPGGTDTETRLLARYLYGRLQKQDANDEDWRKARGFYASAKAALQAEDPSIRQ